ncbi:MAG TPA: penicillin acylase family protein [Candidatus Baltobacteraceae bacterium]|nr:penicillin acylase family protein [Candidatus Baltobacteraceae bacterium]
MRIVIRAVAALLAAIAVILAIYAGNVFAGMHARARADGTIAGLGLYAPVQILRDARGVPHVRAQNEHDLFFAQGYVEGADRLFQLDLQRRFVYGDLSEILGSVTLRADEAARVVPVREIVEREWARLNGGDRAMLRAFADGVNAAASRESTPVEFRILHYSMQPWRPQDSLAVAFATVLVLTDDWNEVAGRVGKNEPLSDPCFDAPVTEGLAHIADPARCSTRDARLDLIRALLDRRPPIGSNEWAAGAAHTASGRALLANDPHLQLGIPGVWYLLDLHAPTFHAAGATLVGTPGITLGHNDKVAWGATNGAVTALSIFDAPPHLEPADWQTEKFRVRFGRDVTKRYYRGAREFGTWVSVNAKRRFVLVRWNAYDDPQSALTTFEALDRARSIEDALAALRTYPGPTQNFELAGVSGRVAYQLAGSIPDDPLWSRGIHPASDLRNVYPPVPFDELPHVAPARTAIVWTSNNKMYGPSYPLRLSPAFIAPCRAYRVARMLRARTTYDIAYFAAMQMDVLSVCERALAAHVPQLAAWDGRFTPVSRDATAAYYLRRALVREFGGMTETMLASRAKPGAVTALAAVSDPSPTPWGTAGAVQVRHPLAALGFSFLNGTTFAGDGDAYTVKVQNYGFSQSFRAVWDVGNWDAGGITIPQGESGRPGSGHYTDEAAAWVAGKLLPLPYSDAAVEAAAVHRLTLEPAAGSGR